MQNVHLNKITYCRAHLTFYFKFNMLTIFKKRKQCINSDKVSLPEFSLTEGLFNRYLKWIGNFVYWEV